ncbi:MAG: tRNA uridine-5-carboxymethylaminomethyl(34) synthesis GTPase MnmE [Bacteroidales bacterium]|nr:tRNA uridine-5-carboxymethylaminomethyl(34) synthesis GTPase MnmE [Bacteroidales bacterium]
MNEKDTICAIATPPGIGALAIVRASGEKAIEICDKIYDYQGKRLAKQPANTIHYGFITNNSKLIDEVLVSIFRAPNSYTGENSVEISCHGSIYIQQEILKALIRNGARQALPGEFTLRAFMNGKMDLSQAEAVADLIASSSEASHNVAINQMRGGFSSELKNLRNKLLHFVSLVELELDFSEEDVEFANRNELKNLIQEVKNVIDMLSVSFEYGNVIKNGIPVAIIGKPNVGKSTLLNSLIKEEKAIVSEIAGTTRDAIEDVIVIEGISFRFIDTAGLRDTDDVIESLGIKVTHEKISKAKIVLWLADAGNCLAEINQGINEIKAILGKKQRLFVLINKIDKYEEAEIDLKYGKINFKGLDKKDRVILISAKKHFQLDRLHDELVNAILPEKQDDVIITNIRHYEALQLASKALERALSGIDKNLPGDLLAQDIRETMHYIGEISGEITTDEILGNIFKNFCIGK